MYECEKCVDTIIVVLSNGYRKTLVDTAAIQQDVVDLDGDGFDSSEDCDDGNSTINPGAEELCDGFDNNCDGEIDEGVLKTFYEDAEMMTDLETSMKLSWLVRQRMDLSATVMTAMMMIQRRTPARQSNAMIRQRL